jgi:hypothetical protein
VAHEFAKAETSTEKDWREERYGVVAGEMMATVRNILDAHGTDERFEKRLLIRKLLKEGHLFSCTCRF